MAQVLNERTLTGNRALLRAASGPNRGRPLGVGVAGEFGPSQDASGATDFGLQDVYELGRAERTEIVIGAVRHSITINYLRLARAESGFDPRDIIANDNNLVIEILDKKNGTVLESFEGCTLRTRNFSVPANRLITQSLVFEALTADKMKVD